MFGNNSAIAVQRWATVISCLLLTLALSSVAMPGYAQVTDTEAPVIELEELVDGVADRSQVFTVQIAEDVGLQDAIFYYRREGQVPFTPARMQALGSTGYYSVSIPTDRTDLRPIEYYFQARDLAGNRTVSGFAFDPYKRTLQPSGSTLQQSGSPDSATTGTLARPTTGIGETRASQSRNPNSLLSKRWVQIALGVLAVGVVASLASDGGSDTRVVPLTFNLQ